MNIVEETTMNKFTEKLAGLFSDEYDDEEYVEEVEFVGREKRSSSSSIEEGEQPGSTVSTKSMGLEEALRGKSSKVLVMEPKAYSESQEIAEHLLQKRAVIVNLQRIAPDQGKRIIDFLSGTIYAINGELQKVSTNTFLCTPDTFGVAGKISDEENRKIQ